MSDPKHTVYRHTKERIADAGLSALLRDQRDAWASDAGEPENANYYAALVEAAEALEARAALAEARLAVLNKQGFIHWDGQRKLWQTFCAVGETLEECADGEIAAALTVDAMIAERGRAATGPEASGEGA